MTEYIVSENEQRLTVRGTIARMEEIWGQVDAPEVDQSGRSGIRKIIDDVQNNPRCTLEEAQKALGEVIRIRESISGD